MIARILKYWSYPNLLRQTPGGHGIWKGIQFTVDETGEADYVILHGHAKHPALVRCPKGCVWLVLGEAPHELANSWHVVPAWIDRVYTTDPRRIGEKYHLSYSGLPWWVDRDYDFLTTCPMPAKVRALSWITSNQLVIAGHHYRMKFLTRVREMEELNLFGRGFHPLQDKWDALAPYRYSIAFENFSNSHYWSEKVMDCFLTWTMPIYFGCTELANFFPRESFVQLHPEHPDPVGFIRDVIHGDLRERNIDALNEARNRVLGRYNLFEFLANEIASQRAVRGDHCPRSRRIRVQDHTRIPSGGFKNAVVAWMRQSTPKHVRRAISGMRHLVRWR